MTLEHEGKKPELPWVRFVPLVGMVLWFILVPILAGKMDSWGKREGLMIMSVVGVGLLVVTLVVGFVSYMKTRVKLGVRDVFLSWCLAANFVLLLIFGFFLVLLWPVVLNSPK